jgi:hypothetical protein
LGGALAQTIPVPGCQAEAEIVIIPPGMLCGGNTKPVA